MAMKNYVFWNITPYSPLKVNRRFGGTCRLHLYGLSQERNQPAYYILHADFLLGLVSNHEDGGDMFLGHVG
jgi:hypothetical protein